MSKELEICPKCLGAGEEMKNRFLVKECSLCKGEGEVDAEIAEDFIHSINVIYTEDEYFND